VQHFVHFKTFAIKGHFILKPKNERANQRAESSKKKQQQQQQQQQKRQHLLVLIECGYFLYRDSLYTFAATAAASASCVIYFRLQ
jgi:hypothetical protein